MKDNVWVLWVVLVLAVVVGGGTHIWMLNYGLAADMVDAHAWLNIFYSGIVAIVAGWGLYEAYN